MIYIWIPTIRQEKIGAVKDNVLQSMKWVNDEVEVDFIVEGKSYAQAINIAYEKNKHKFQPHDWFFMGADDLLFYDRWFEEAMIHRGDKLVVGTNDLHNPDVLSGNHATHYLVSYHYFSRYGSGTADDSYPVLYDYKHNYTDTEFIETAKFRGEFVYVPSSKVEHLHPIFGLGKHDEGYQKSASTSPKDQLTFNSRKHLWTKIRK